MRTLKRLILLALTGVFTFGGWFVYHINTAVQLPAVPYEFTIKPGSSLKSVARQLYDARVLPDIWSFVLLGRVTSQAGLLKAGNYQLAANATPLQLLKRITSGDVSQSEIKFIEGWTFRQLRKVLNDHPGIRHDTAKLSEAEILKLIGASETAAEGLFFPDTYYFAEGGSDVAILKRAYNIMQDNLKAAWSRSAHTSRTAGGVAQIDLPLADPYEVLILASIVEKETGRENDRALITGVFINRLRLGMLLQTDPTVIYGMGEKFDGNLRKDDLLADHEYNTYTRPGLPPTPIAMPGLASIEAALNPAKTDALYFVARGDGSSQFSANLTDHNRAVAKYQKRR